MKKRRGCSEFRLQVGFDVVMELSGNVGVDGAAGFGRNPVSVRVTSSFLSSGLRLAGGFGRTTAERYRYKYL